ncbi:MAG: hypothetical protein LHW47_01275 [Candidatus Cloacimonetes bacterium]|nr:hypothetical protein [Candidatus Cloacimonadota bacterium]
MRLTGSCCLNSSSSKSSFCKNERFSPESTKKEIGCWQFAKHYSIHSSNKSELVICNIKNVILFISIRFSSFKIAIFNRFSRS